MDNDNLDDPVTFVATGEFRYQHRDTRYVDNDYRYSNTANSGSTARWTVDVAPTRRAADDADRGHLGRRREPGDQRPVPRSTPRDGTTLAGGPFLVNQNPTPNDFEDIGRDVGAAGQRHAAGRRGQLIVELGTDGINGYVLADAVWAGPSTTPEIQVFDGGTELIDEVSAINLGYTELLPASPVTKTFTVWNTGGVDLTLFEPISLPPGFSLVQSFGTTTVAAGSSTTFRVAVDAAAPGPVGGEISFANSDSDENPFEFNISAQVGVQIVDNDDRARESAPGPRPFTLYNNPQYFGGDVRYHSEGTGSNWVDWEFTGLTAGRYYQVATTWQTGYERATNAPYSIYGGLNPAPAATPLATVRIDQSVPPNDFTDSGTAWEELTMVQVPAGQTALTVRLSDDANTWVYADAVRIEQVYLPEVHVTVDGLPLDPGSGIDLGTLLRGSAGEKTIRVTNAGLLPLVISSLTLPNAAGHHHDQHAPGRWRIGLGPVVHDPRQCGHVHHHEPAHGLAQLEHLVRVRTTWTSCRPRSR